MSDSGPPIATIATTIPSIEVDANVADLSNHDEAYAAEPSNDVNDGANVARSPAVAFLEIDGKLLSGGEFDEYCKAHGLCRRCARVRTHRRLVKVFGKGKKWDPLTLHDDETGDFTVYKGFCLQPTCYTMGQAKRLLGETGANNATSGGENANSNNARRRRKRLTGRLKKKRPSRRTVGDDGASVSSDMSSGSTRSTSSILSGIGQRMFRRGKNKRRTSSASSMASSVSSMDFSDDDTIDSSMLVDSSHGIDENTATTLEPGKTSPIVQHRVEQLVLYDYFTVLDLSKVELRPEDISAISNALQQAKTLESIVLDKCKLKDDSIEQLVQALQSAQHYGIRKMSLRQNTIGNRGALALEPFIAKCSLLEELDMSENGISSRGAVAIFSAFRDSKSLQHLNLAQNEIWDLDDGSFLRTNGSLKILNLDGNFMHDEGAEQIAVAISENAANCRLEKLFLGWNGISDDGATALAKMLEVNHTLQVIGLAENDISNTGARALLSSLSINTSVREISGLYHNQIDRKFIIVAIKRLLHRYGDRNQKQEGEEEAKEELKPNQPPQQQQKPVTHNENDNDDKSETSENSLNWAAQLYSTANEEEKTEEDDLDTDTQHFEAPAAARKSSIALEAIEHWDWGTFGIEEIEAAGEQDSAAADEPESRLQMPDMDESEVGEPLALQPNGEAPPLPMDRVTVFQSAPLAYFKRQTSEHHAVPLMDYEYERSTLQDALKDPDLIGSVIELEFENATTDRVRSFFAKGDSPIMHFSCYGSEDCFALENGFGYMHALAAADLKNYVQSGDGRVRVVVVSSHHSRSIGDAFIKAGIPHVVCCQSDAVFRDYANVEFAKVLYQELARNSTLQAAFNSAVEGVTKSPLVKNARNLADKFVLLPEQPPRSSYHDVPVLFKKSIIPRPMRDRPDTSILPPVPGQFLGREVDMYEILESLRVDDVVRVAGTKGSGKASVISATSRYVLSRPNSFMINNVFWLPAPPDVMPMEDTLYGDLCEVTSMLLAAEEDIWEEEEYSDARERIMIELEGQKSIVVVDGRHFKTEASGENLERFLGHLLNEASVKIILITTTEASTGRTRTSRSEETTVSIGPLDFKSSALLFGSNCQLVGGEGNPAVQSAEEFASILVPPSISRMAEQSKNKTQRQRQLYERLGNGNPKNIIAVSQVMPECDFSEILGIAQRPEIQIDSAGSLESALRKYTAMKEKAVKSGNFRRAQDFAGILDELDGMKSKYPTLADLVAKERGMKRELTDALGKRKYDEANGIKRKLLALKKVIMKEKNAQPDNDASNYTASGKMAELQAQMDNMLAIAEKMKMEKSLSELDSSQVLGDDAESASLTIQRDAHTCILHVYASDILQFKYPNGSSGIVAWANERGDLSTYAVGQDILKAGGASLAQDIETLPVSEETTWGPVKIGTGKAVMLGPNAYGELASKYVILSVSPLSPSNVDDDWDGDANNRDEDAFHFLETTLRAAYRSSFGKISAGSMEAIAIPMITTKETGGTYERTLKVGLQTVVDGSKFSDLKHVHLIANSGKEATMLIKMALAMGLSCVGTY